MKLLYEEKTKVLRRLIFDTRNELGGGWSEEIYHQALLKRLKENDVPFISKPRQALRHHKTLIHTFEPDIIVWEKIILELKVHPPCTGKTFPPKNIAQLIHYLKFNEIRLGLLVNFAHPRVGIRRIIFDESNFKLEEDYERMLPFVTNTDKQLLRQVQKLIKDLANQYGLGYPETVYRNLIAAEMALFNIKCCDEVEIPAIFQGEHLGVQIAHCLLIDGRFLLNIKSSMKNITNYEFIKTRTFLRALHLKVGWVINFGKKAVQIYAISDQDQF